MNYWLHRISYYEEVSYPLLKKGYLSIGFSDFSEKEFVNKAFKNWNVFEKYFDRYWGVRKRTRYNLWRFLSEMKIGDYVLVPSSAEFSIYEIIDDKILIGSEIDTRNLEDWSGNEIKIGENGLLYRNNSSKNVIDLGFFRKVKAIVLNIPRRGIDEILYDKLKIRYTNARITDVKGAIDIVISEYQKKNILEKTEQLNDDEKFSYILTEQYKDINDDYFSVFRNNIEKIIKLNTIAENLSDEIRDYTFKILFSNAITCLEAYLFEAFKAKINNNQKYLEIFVETFKNFSENKFKLSELFNQIKDITNTVNNTISKILYHNLPVVKSMYVDTFQIDFPKINNLMSAISKRHDIVHRGGKTVKGEVLKIGSTDVINMCDEIKEFVNSIEKQLNDIK